VGGIYEEGWWLKDEDENRKEGQKKDKGRRGYA
jgi:hypothetical protein